MSTIGYSSWAVDLKDVGTVYPFAGSELLMVIICIVLWLAFHLIQIKGESAEWADVAHDADDNAAGQSIDRY